MRVTEKMKKLLSILLCLCMLLQNAPVVAFAAGEDNLCEHHPEHTAECHYAEAVAGVECAHECGEECAEGCVHTAHDDLCGYIEAVEGHDCHYECAECANNELSSRTSPLTCVAIPEGDAQNQEIATSAPDGDLLAMTEAVCNCGTDDPAIHATTCAVYVAPENPQCFCAEKCTEANVWCDVCGFDVTACTGTDTAAAYADGDDLAISGAWMSSNTPYLASGSTTASATQPETGGYAYWDAASNTLTLNNFTSATDAATGIFYDGSAETLRIELVGNNSVTGGTAAATHSGVCLYNTNTNILFSGGGTLTATGIASGYGVDATGGNITVDSGTTLIATGVWIGRGVYADSITVNAGGSLTGNGGESGGHGVSASSITVNGGSCTGNGGESGGHGVYAGTGGITVNGGSLTGNGGESGGHGVYADSITVNGGSLTGNSSDSHGVDADSITVENGGIMEATGKDRGVSVVGTSESGGSITVNGGSLTAKGEKFGVYTYLSSISVSGDSHIVAIGGNGNNILLGDLPEDYYYASGDGTDKTFTHSTDASLTGTVTETYFELVTAQHLSDTYTSNGDATHSRYCSCALHTKVTAPEACSGGTATCTTPANCANCGASYGDFANHSMGYVADEEANTITYRCGTCDTQNLIFTLVIPTGVVYGDSLEVPHYDSSDKTYQGDYPEITLDGALLNDFVPGAKTYEVVMTWGDKTVSGEYTIAKADVGITSPTPNTLTYTGEAHNLISQGEATGGTMVYSLTEEGEYTTSIPQGTNAGDYKVWYYVQGDANHNDSAKDSVDVTIAKAEPRAEDFIFQAPGDLTYNGETKSASVSVQDGVVGMGDIIAVMYYNGDSNIAVEKQPISAGDYFVQINVGEGENYTAKSFFGGEDWVFTIAPKMIYIAEANLADVVRNDSNSYDLTVTSISFLNVVNGDTLTLGEDYTATAEQLEITGSNLTGYQVKAKVTVTLLNSNYTLGDGVTYNTYANIVEHEHDWKYTANGATITATCANTDGHCPDAEQSITLTVPESYTYTGDATYSASVEGSIEDVTHTVLYTGANTGYSSVNAPKDADTYTVTLTAGNASVSDTFTISRKNIANCDAKLSESSFVYNGTAPALTVSVLDSGVGSTPLIKDTDYTIGTVSGINVGRHKLTVTGIGNYTGTVELDYTITAKEVSIIGAAIQSVTYDPNGYTLTVTGVTFDGVVDGENLAYTAEAILGNTNAFGEQDATVTVTLNNSNYNLATATYQTKVTINKAAATVTAAPTPQRLTYTGVAQNLIDGGKAEGGEMQYSTDNQTWSTTIPQGTAAGEYTVYYKVVGDANHSDTAVDSVEVTIARAQAVITVDTTTITVTYGDTVNLPKATTNFGTVVCDKTADDLVNAGTYTVTYTVVGTENFEGATKTLTVKIEQLAVAEPTVTGTYTYTGSELTAQLTGLESCMTIASGNKGTNAGSYEVRITLDGNHKWADGSDGKVQWSIAKTQATITVDTDPITVTYGEAVQLPVASSNFGTVSCDKQASDLVNAGTYTVTYTVAGTNNFDGDTKTLTVTVAKKTVAEPTVSGTYTYTGSGHTVTLDGFDGEYMTIVSGNTGTNAADYEVVITLDGNHQWADDSDGKVTWTIAPASLETAVITLDQTTYIYDGQSHYPAVTVTLDGRKLAEGTDYKVIYMRPRMMVNGKPTKWFGDHTISEICIDAHDDYYAVVLGLGNYYTEDAFTLYQNFVIQPRPLTIKAADQTILRYASINRESISITEGSLLQGHTLTGWVLVQNVFDEGQNVETIVGTHTNVLYIDEVSVVIKAGEEAVTGNYSITQEKGTLTVVEHTHQWSYTASGDTITAKCEGTIGRCDVETVIIKLNAPADLSYNGSEKSVTVTQNPAGILPDVPAVEYQGDRKATGDHTAKLTMGGATAQLTFTITCEHSFQAGEYLWNADNTACTVTGTCEKGCGATTEATASVSSRQTTAPTCEEKGETTYTATFAESWAAKQTKTVADIPARNHAWTVSYDFAPNGKTCTATRICGNDADHNVTVNGKITAAVKTPATCEEKGWNTYTATFAEDWAAKQTQDVEDIPALEHAWTVSYDFAADGSTCTALRACGNDEKHNVTAKAMITSKETKAPTTTTLGETTYTATFEADWAETQNKTVADIPMLNDVVIPDDIQGGNASVDNETPATGDKVTVTVTPDIGKEVDKITVKDENGEEVPVTKNEDGSYTYEQPAGDVTIDVNMKDTEYKVDIPETEGGKAETDKDAPIMGDKVTVTVTPDIGKEVDEITVTDKDGNEIPVTKNEDGTYTYEQPAGDVTIDVTMKDTKYDVQIPETEGGKAETDKDSPILGDEVTITVTPDKGQKVENITVTDKDGNSIPVTDNGDGTYTYEQPVGNVTVEVEFGIDSIQVVPEGENPFQAGHEVQIDGITVPVDSVGEVWLKNTGSKLMTTHTYSTNEEGWQYPTGMQVWYLNWNDKDGDGELDHCDAIPVSELENYMTYQGTSIRIGGSSDGIRFFTAVPTEVNNKLMQGQLLTGMLEGYKLVEMGTLYAKAVSGRELTTDNGVESYVYGGDAGTSFRVFSQSGDASWYTGMLVGLEGNAATLDMDIISRPYAVLESEDGERVTIYGGSIVRSVYDVALQNQDTWASSTAYDNYVEKIISTVEAAKG